MNLAQQLCLTAAGLFFLTGLITGIWKYIKMIQSENAQAPYYVDTAHRSSLLYAFAAILLYVFAGFSRFSDSVNAWAAGSALAFFAAAILTYILHGLLNDTDNQFKKPFKLGSLPMPKILFHGFMVLLIAGEVGGSAVLIIGALLAIW